MLKNTKKFLTKINSHKKLLIFILSLGGIFLGHNLFWFFHDNYANVGLASYYGKALHGRKTASGQIYNMNNLTAAHRRLPFGTKLKVINLKNNREVIVRINDRGPYKTGRIIDLSKAAARKLGMLKNGIVKVKIKKLDK